MNEPKRVIIKLSKGSRRKGFEMATTKQIEAAIIDSLMTMIDRDNYGMFSHRKTKDSSMSLLRSEGIRICRNKGVVTRDEQPIYKIRRRYAKRKTNGNYNELKPTLEAIA